MEWKYLLCEERIRKSGAKKGDLRSAFEKDYHRIIGSASFRRLQDKTQVFPLDKSDFVRTRLTHSLEVSSFGKSLGKSVSKIILRDQKDPGFLPEYSYDICDILSCGGLIHDIGNPPFGHFGETVIRKWFKNNLPLLEYRGRKLTELLEPQMLEDFYNYEGNAQGLRLVTKLHHVVDEHGMNLTKGLLSSVIKYPVSSLEIDRSCEYKKKLGYFYADRETFRVVDSGCKTEGKRNPLVYLLEAADDIAYKTADIEDAYKKGLIDSHILKSELGKKYEDRLKGTGYNALQRFIVNIQREALEGVAEAFGENYTEIMAGEFEGNLIDKSPTGEILGKLGHIAFKYAFSSRQIYLMELGGKSILNSLLESFVPAVIDPEKSDDISCKIYSLISENYKNIYEIYSKDKPEAERLYLRLLLAADYISGMTDSFAKDLYSQLKGI
ncbi:MAG: deoxyguanosinetriphosphate triphosphohydrolase [Clostridiales bacterium]|nr:deoxyguanosinetriphosphate triphosphohydrolase [Clostridiales bacterium]